MRHFLAAFGIGMATLVVVQPLHAQPAASPAVMELRARIAMAAAKGDLATLGDLFTDDFTHTHAGGGMDGKAARLKSLVGSEGTIETVAPAEIAIRAYGDDTAVAVGRTTIGPNTFRWTAVYVRRDGRWRAAASHASRVN